MRNHAAYSKVIIQALQERSQLTWHEASVLLVSTFGWTHKTASNRIHELIDAEIIRVKGEYRMGLFGRSNPESRIIYLPESSETAKIF